MAMNTGKMFYGQEDVCYRGSEKKYLVDLACSGFDMDTDDWDVEIVCGKKRIRIEKRGEYAAADELPDGLAHEDGKWYVYVDTGLFPEGMMKAIATAYVADDGASGGIREEKARRTLCQLCDP